MKGEEKFTYSDLDADYVVKLKSKSYWWLLLFLLLLLPLLLLLRFDKTLVFNTIHEQTGQKLSNVNVTFRYVDRCLFKTSPLRFFTADTIVFDALTDESGTAIFTNVNYSLYSKLIYFGDLSFVYAEGQCIRGDTLSPKFHSLKNYVPENIKLGYREYDVDFLVVDADDNQPLPDAMVESEMTASPDPRRWTNGSDADGRFVLEKVPLCASLNVVASLDGYASDTVSGDLEWLCNNIINRTLRLKPLGQTISFIVKDLISGQPIPGATAKLIVVGTGQEITATTNTNGTGKAAFEDILSNKTFKIELSHPNYFDTLTVEYKTVKFVKLSEDQRSVYMRPKNESMVFRDVDAMGNPIKGVKNIIYVNGSKVGEQYSNNIGCFTVGSLASTDKLSIKAVKPGYKTNSNKIKDKLLSQLSNQIDRDIPLELNFLPGESKPKKDCGVHFSGTLLSDVAVAGHISKIYSPDKFGEYVGNGDYPNNALAFPNAVKYTFDAIAVDKGTRLVIYSKPNFEGEIVLDVTGPALINNVKWKNDSRIASVNTKDFVGGLEANYPKGCRRWSDTNMNEWDNGSVKITCGHEPTFYPSTPTPVQNDDKNDKKKDKDKKKKK